MKEEEENKIVEKITANLAALLKLNTVPLETPVKKNKGSSSKKTEKLPQALKYPFVDVLYQSQSILSKKERIRSEWNEKILYFVSLFAEYNEPFNLHPSLKYDQNPSFKPMVVGAFPKQVKRMAADYHILLQNRRGEKTWATYLTFGLSLMSPEERKQACENMNRLGFPTTEKTDPKLLKLLFPKGIKKEVIVDRREEIGTSYEQQLEKHYNGLGYHVFHNGLQKKFKDGGVDLVLIKNGETSLIQAKAWGRGRSISEHDAKMLLAKMQDWWDENKNGLEVVGELRENILAVSNVTCVSPSAEKFATSSGLNIQHIPFLDKWEDTKCVVGRSGDKIYYTPKHAIWKKLDMLSDKRRFFATEEEAINRGFSLPNSKKK